jgi:ribosome-associated toxin RatA of RatAB toxin-antitoxin module
MWDRVTAVMSPIELVEVVRGAASTCYNSVVAIRDSREVTIEAKPEDIINVLADVASMPSWSPQHERADILSAYDDGRPKRVKLKVKAAGFADQQIVEYSWSSDTVNWKLISSGLLKSQEGRYTLTSEGDKTKVRFELEIGLAVPTPGFLLKGGLKGAMTTATKGLQKQVSKVKNT